MGGVAKLGAAVMGLKALFDTGLSAENKKGALFNIEKTFGVDIGTPKEGAYFTPDGKIAGESIPALNEGAIVPRTPGGRDVTVSEGRHDEAVIPLNKLYDMLAGNNSKPTQLVMKDVTLEVRTDKGLVTLGTINQEIEAYLNSALTGKPNPQLLA